MAATQSAAGGARPTRQRERQTAPEDLAGPGLNRIRHDLEHKPRDSSAAGPRQALEALRLEWGAPYILSYHEGLYLARRREGPPAAVISGETPGEIGQALSRDWGEAP